MTPSNEEQQKKRALKRRAVLQRVRRQALDVCRKVKGVNPHQPNFNGHFLTVQEAFDFLKKLDAGRQAEKLDPSVKR
jgi:hypothetical protein